MQSLLLQVEPVAGAADAAGAVPQVAWITMLVFVGVGLVLLLFGKKLAKLGFALVGLLYGGVLGITAAELFQLDNDTLPLIVLAGAILGVVLSFALYKFWVVLGTGVACAYAAPAAMLIALGTGLLGDPTDADADPVDATAAEVATGLSDGDTPIAAEDGGADGEAGASTTLADRLRGVARDRAAEAEDAARDAVRDAATDTVGDILGDLGDVLGGTDGEEETDGGGDGEPEPDERRGTLFGDIFGDGTTGPDATPPGEGDGEADPETEPGDEGPTATEEAIEAVQEHTEAAISALGKAGVTLRDLYRNETTQIAAWWGETGKGHREQLVLAGLIGLIVGLLLGVLTPTFATTVQTALAGAVLLTMPGRYVVEHLIGGTPGWVPQTPRTILVVIGLVALVGIAVQSYKPKRKSDDSD